MQDDYGKVLKICLVIDETAIGVDDGKDGVIRTERVRFQLLADKTRFFVANILRKKV